MPKILEDKATVEMRKRLLELYPIVNENITPIPKCWNPKDKYKYLTLSHRNLRVSYKGHGNSYKDAGCIRTAYHVPTSCGFYYFEIKIIDKGFLGFIGIGLSCLEGNLNRLPGWDHTSYGYHGDDGCKFHSDGDGRPYGPSFTTDDVIGCGINFIDKSCFFTKNGINLGVAFMDLPLFLYPTVGMQTKGEIIEANFGQKPFMFDAYSYLNQLKVNIRTSIINTSIKQPCEIVKMVLSYLTHHGYIEAAVALAKRSGLTTGEDVQSMTNRLYIMRYIKDGKLEEAINLTNNLYPILLSERQDLLFKLMCRQFIEILHKQSPRINQEIETNRRSQHHNLIMNEECASTVCENLIILGRNIFNLYKNKISKTDDASVCCKKMQEAFSLLSYNNLENSKMKWLLDASQRESICFELNSAIMKYSNRPQISPIDLTPILAEDLLNFMIRSSIPSSVFVNINDYLPSNIK